MDKINELIQSLINTLLHSQNQFASGGLLLMAVGGIIASLRQIPGRIWSWIKHQITVSMTITDSEFGYYAFKAWLETQNVSKRNRHVDILSKGQTEYHMVPAPGHHWMFYRGRVLSVLITRSEEQKLGTKQRSESITLTTVGRRQKIFKTMMADVYDLVIRLDERKPELYSWGQWGEWTHVHGYIPRPLESVILPDNDKNRVMKDIEKFRESQKWYAEMGIPYRKGYLFYGPPGTGKTSLVTGLSSHFKSNVYILKLTDMSDTALREAVHEVQPNSFIVMEDIDTVTATRDRAGETEEKKTPGVTLSGLLNVIDGVFSPSGAIFVMTTNHKDKLDPALIRPGRVDIQLEIGYATQDQKRQLTRRFFPNRECPQHLIDKQMTMAEMQQALMEMKHAIDS